MLVLAGLGLGQSYQSAYAQGEESLPRRADKTAPDSVRGVIAALRRYNADERRLADAGAMVPADLMAHWKRLAAVRASLGKLEARGALHKLQGVERVQLRHELAQLLGLALDLAEVRGEIVSDRLKEADELRKQDLVDIAASANHNLDFEVREVLGIRVEGGA